MSKKQPLSLTPELVALCERDVEDPGPDPRYVQLSDADVLAKADELHRECGDGPLWLFAYGSLIWKPEVETIEARRATARGWHRSFSMELPRWRGSPEQPGQMMVLERGGTCHGVAFRLPDEDRAGHIYRMLYRESEYEGDLDNPRWLNADTSTGRIRALAFWAAPTASFPFLKLTPEETASRIARACGHLGSNAAYLYNTVAKLDEHGIRDRNLWRLQELVAAEIRQLADAGPLGRR
ncbi:gamma-glutamylcyclotransferase [Mesorhizobium sp. ZMM04-5]|uniref:glutathione-specific gamma-glutamylcyclotransferase n=1 Tax=Mesorhizobium marinum TaxID=3228790 RepID=A0ABV3QV95_9HYPH